MWWSQGKARIRNELGARVKLDPASVPLRRELLEWLETQHASARKMVLVANVDQRVAAGIAGRVKLFDEIIAGTIVRSFVARKTPRVGRTVRRTGI